VVIAIIAILAAILFPVFAAAREKARQTTCASNLKQLGLAFVQYQQDYDELSPLTNGCLGIRWANPLYTYVKSVAVFDCPDDPTKPPTTNVGDGNAGYYYNSNLTTSNTSAGTGSYFSPLYPSGQSGQPFYSGLGLAQFTSPSVTVILCEGEGTGSTVY
jgi:type II secretory pathway pseudopilin PulG